MKKGVLFAAIGLAIFGGGGFGAWKFGLIGSKPKATASKVSTPAPKSEPTAAPMPPPAPKKKSKPPVTVASAKVEPERGEKKLAKLWNGIAPEALAKIVEGWKPDEVARIFSRMDPERVAPVLATMEPERASKISRAIREHAARTVPAP